ncbi:hypothetical protein C0991_004655 [Blastosporella zonata]|nr:hypothetical protein C0991_004655 [Blastosporella zonata]
MSDSIITIHSKAHDAVNQTHGGVKVSPSAAEIDRWGGNTHLLAEVGTPDSCTSGASHSVTLTEAGSEYIEYQWSDVQVSDMHPTLADDMRCFDVGTPAYGGFSDFPATGPQPVSQPAHDDHITDPSFYTPTEYQTYQPQHHHSPFLQTAPILDATWQTFAEQLGF